MSVQVKWRDSEKTTLYYTFQDPWNWDEFYTATKRGQEMREERGPEGVVVILDFAQARLLPDGALGHLGNQFRRKPAGTEQVQKIIVLSSTPFMRALADILRKMFPQKAHKIQFAQSVEEALMLAAQKELL